MRTLMIAGLAMVSAIVATPAESQRLAPAPMGGGQVMMGGGQMRGGGQVMGGGQIRGGGQVMGGGHAMPPRYPGAHYPSPQQHQPMQRQSRWGGSIGGHWSGGMNAPGGWNAYRRPTRGRTLPRFWIAPTFYISDFADYGLATPPAGYGWSRYYDDAVLIDGRGRVWDSVEGVDWDGAGYAEGGEGGYAVAGDGYAQGGAGGYGAGYAPPQQQQAVEYRGDERSGYASSSYSSNAGYANSGGYVSNGYYFPPATTTVVTIQSAPVVTTTTTEYVETYRTARRVYHPVRHRVVRRSCTCSCGCR